MARSVYIQDEPKTHPRLRRLLIFLIALVLLAALGIGFFLHRQDRQFDRYVLEYEEALAATNFTDAVELYRKVQEQALAGGPLQQQQTYADIMTEIEQITQARLQEIETKLLAGENLSDADLAFAESMAEVTAVHLVQTLRDLASRFLSGEVSFALMNSAFSQLSDLDNLRPAIGSLPQQFPAMKEAASKVKEAESATAEGRFWQAHELYLTLLSEPEQSDFVQEQVQIRLEYLLDAMYEPLLQEASELMEGGRYLSAEGILIQLQNVYPEDATIASYLAESRENIPEELIAYQGTIEFLSIRPLIISPKIAFDGDAYAATANDAMITVAEFREIIQQLHENDYILIDSDSLYAQDRSRETLLLPPGKKPLVLVVDGLNYYASRRETGNAWDLVLDENGQVAAQYRDENGNMVVDREKEIIGILDDYVERNPDFSLDGAKGTLSLSGYECIFGKVTDTAQLQERNRALQDNGHATIELSATQIEANAREVEKIIKRLKQTGWRFASSTYGYINAREHSLERIIDDTEKWLERVGQLTGPVTMLNYPNGAFISGSDERAAYLREQGFILFGGLGPQPYFFTASDFSYYYVDKTPINGFTLRNHGHYRLDRLFDPVAVYDDAARPQ